ncbi:cadherin-like domain-containing protein, partial [Algoriphagus aestuariicola]
MEYIYRITHFKVLFLLLLGWLSAFQVIGQTYTIPFDSGPDEVSTVSHVSNGVQFNFVFTLDGDGGDFSHIPDFGAGNSASLDLESAIFNTGTTERVTIKRNDGSSFSFKSLFLRNDEGTTVTIQGYLGGNPVGASQSVANGANGTYTFNLTVDEVRLTASDFYQVNLDDFAWSFANTAPVATAPSVSGVQEDIPYALPDNIQVTDAEGNNQTLTFTITGGTLSLGTTGITFAGSGNGSSNFTASGTLAAINTALDAAVFTPTSNLNGSGAGTISFIAYDGTSNSNTASVTFDIAAINDAPTGTGLPASVTVEEDAVDDVFNISALTLGDVDAGSGMMTLMLQATGGIFDLAAGTGITLSGHLTSTVTFTGTLANLNAYIDIPTNIYFRPDANISGVNVGFVQVSINDNGNSGVGGPLAVNLGIVQVNVTAVNDPPTAVGDIVSTEQNVAVTGNVLTNDSDIEGNLLTASLTSAASQGTVVLNADGGFTYTPNVGYFGGDSFQYQVCDNGSPSQCSTATVTITVTESAPVVTSVTVPANGTYGVGQTLSFTVNFDKSVTVSGGTPQLGLTIGSETKSANLFSGGGTSSLTFVYYVETNAMDTDGISINAISLSGATINGSGGTAANLTLNSVGSTSGVLVDGVAPSGYGVQIDQNPITPANANAVSFSYTGAELGASYYYTIGIPSSCDFESGNGIVTGINGQITGIDLSEYAAGDIELTFRLVDAAGNYGDVVTSLVLKLDNLPPVATAAIAPTVTEDTDAIFTGMSVSDSDGDDQTLSFTIAGGTLTIGTTGISFGGSGNGSTSFTASGTLAAINTAVSSATFTPTPDLYGADAGTISFVANDGTENSNVASVTFDIVGVKEDQTINFPAIASKTYGDAIFVLGDANTSEGLTITYTAADPSVVSITGNSASILKAGSTLITATQAGDTETNPAPSVSQTLAVNPKGLDVSATSGIEKVYGSGDPVLSYSVSGFISPDNVTILSGSLSRAVGENVGIYAINIGTLSAGSNYTLNFTGADFAITPASITGIIFEDDSFVYDGLAKSLVIAGTLPSGASVSYADN